MRAEYGAEPGKIHRRLEPQRIERSKKFAADLQQRAPKTGENTPNYEKSEGGKLPATGKEKSIKALRL